MTRPYTGLRPKATRVGLGRSHRLPLDCLRPAHQPQQLLVGESEGSRRVLQVCDLLGSEGSEGATLDRPNEREGGSDGGGGVVVHTPIVTCKCQDDNIRTKKVIHSRWASYPQGVKTTSRECAAAPPAHAYS